MNAEERRSPLPPEDAGDEDIMENPGESAASDDAALADGRQAGSPLPPDLHAGEDELRPEAETDGQHD